MKNSEIIRKLTTLSEARTQLVYQRQLLNISCGLAQQDGVVVCPRVRNGRVNGGRLSTVNEFV